MIRLGYAGCQACHLSPQGRGLLTEYGKGIDDAQSSRHGAYDADEDRWRRLFHDVRLMTQLTSEAREQPERATSAAVRLWYRNTTRLSHTLRVSGTLSVDAPARAQEVTKLQPQPSQPQAFVRQALLEVTPHKNVYIGIGRDTLPSGVEIADQATYVRARNGQGLTDVPTQAKLFWSTERFQVAPYVYGPSGQEAPGFRSSGAGVLAEKYLVGDHLAAGIALRMARNTTFDERLAGVYARFGMGRWGVLTEHDVVRRAERSGEQRRFDQYTGFVQLFFYPTDWLVTSLSADRLQMDAPYSDARWYLRPEVSARLNPHITIAASLRDQYLLPSQRSTAFVLQLFLKSVN
ncbi:hypothetical protein LuPra_05342 [Luteitalea pratensis]|uniref:Uncharacterized protein n=1 Tax=Luteitalea pratensis TaxID=1855912 RepID=A0A143PVI3_LUTPR|nr:hypothetical protein [Luteitalea pratensis]AMY12070.1 hypothetical protein LuPra_05342 [Luteitalea pratensis]